MDFTKMTKEDIYKYFHLLIRKSYSQDKNNLDARKAEKSDYKDMDYSYNDYLAKLEYVKMVKEDPEVWTKYVNLLMQIQSSGVDDFDALGALLSAAVIFKSFRYAYKLDYANLLMASFCSRELEVKDYSFYMTILTDEEVTTRITSKTKDLYNQSDIASEVMGYLDEFKGDCIHADDYEPLRQGSLEVIDSYEIPKVR